MQKQTHSETGPDEARADQAAGHGHGRDKTRIKFGSRTITLPGNRLARTIVAVVLIIGGVLGFLPILGFWMIPLGLLILSVDFGWARRLRRRFLVWFARRYPATSAKIFPSASQSGLHGRDNSD